MLQLLGKPPYGEYVKFGNVEIVRRMMKTMKTDFNPRVMQKYEKNVALIVS